MHLSNTAVKVHNRHLARAIYEMAEQVGFTGYGDKGQNKNYLCSDEADFLSFNPEKMKIDGLSKNSLGEYGNPPHKYTLHYYERWGYKIFDAIQDMKFIVDWFEQVKSENQRGFNTAELKRNIRKIYLDVNDVLIVERI